MKQWSRVHTSCIHCETTERMHAGHGLCIKCYEEHPELRNYDSVESVEESMAPLPLCLTPDKRERASGEQIVQVIAGSAAGMSQTQIGREVGLSGRTVAELIERYDYEIRTLTRLREHAKPVYRLRLMQRLAPGEKI